MIEVSGNLWAFERPYAGLSDVLARNGCDAIVITTNGSVRQDGGAVMGRGVARDCAVKYPEVQAILGWMLATRGNRCHVVRAGNPSIVTLPVKHVWNEPADPALIEQRLFHLVEIANVLGWRRIAMPRPGCGNGQLKWSQVRVPMNALLDERFLVVYEDGHD